MAAQTSPYESDALSTGTVDAVVIGGGAADLNGALIPARSRRSAVVIDSGTPRNAPTAVHGLIVLDGLKPPTEDLPDDMGRRLASAMATTPEIRGVRAAGNATALPTRTGASTAAGALTGAHVNAVPAAADTDAALAAAQRTTG
ncbi:hypothetical protein GCM10010358_24130 [Streptomyces minutiscleroticus]|uniref:Uncharacterized protein n=1 Tax=Streptomyces minutiscleroticus TaxID=68238 RepID=A0A918KQ05_9ACTN|nr:hypothetical protein GCM10010358_24130 [Streptomyces minutiscleroticus]